ncbi:MAG: hypothetical protein WBP81_35720 [Solirubrobacteraceae bacterium]
MENSFRCPVCAEVIGVYEPVIAVGGGAHRKTSLAREPELASGQEIIIHHGCASDLGPGFGSDESVT